MTFFKYLYAATALIAVSACGGATTGTGADPFDVLASRGLALVDKNQADFDNDNFADLGVLDAVGTANFAGYAAYDVNGSPNAGGQEIIDGADYISEATMSINLATDGVSGGFTNFFETETRLPVDGSATWSGIINLNADTAIESAILGNASGSLDIDGETASLTADIEANLYGDGSTVAGFIAATSQTSAGSTPIYGAFIAD